MARRPATGGDILCDVLHKLGVTTVFGIPGTQNIHLFEAFRNSSLRTVVATTELAAGFMAVGHYRATGKIALLATIPGPGFTYALTPLAEAKQDSAALIYLLVRSANLPGKTFKLQAIDQEEIARSLVKQYFRIKSAGDIVSTITEAHALATSGEPGPVIVELDSTLVTADVGETETVSAGVATANPVVADSEVDQVVTLLAASTRPVLMLGQGAAGASEEIRRLADILGSAVISTNSGRGIIPENQPSFVMGDLNHRTVEYANSLVDNADLVLALGCKFTHNGSAGFHLKLPEDKLVHVDAGKEVLGANYPGKLLIQADISDFVSRLLLQVDLFSSRSGRWETDEIEKHRAGFRTTIDESVAHMPKPLGIGDVDIRAFFKLFRDVLPDDACVVTDSGLHQIMVRRFFEVRSPRGLILPSDFQSMGFGLPAAIGARLGDIDRKVVLVIGDGGMAMSAMELLTAARENIDLPVMVVNDGHLGQIRMQQFSNYGHEFAVKLRNPDFESLAQSFSINYFRPGGNPAETIRTWVSTPGVSLLEVRVQDSAQMRVERAKSIMKQAARDHLHSSILRWIKKLMGRGR